MKTKFMFPIVAVIAAVVMTFGASSFMNKEDGKKVASPKAPVLFAYSPATQSEALLETAGSWTQIAVASSASCPTGTNIVCVSHADAATIAAMPGGSNPAKFANYLASLPSATNYINSNSDRRKN